MTDKKKKVILSGVQPSNRLTLGNYLGAVKNWVQLQKDHECIFMAVDLHTITVPQDPIELREQTYRILATYLAAGINPEEAILFVQSHVSEHAELGWILNCFAYMGEFNRMTQFKDKGAKQGENIRVGLFTYPALMAADILLYQADLVPVGEDQKQHIEITRDLAERMNKTFNANLFTVPQPYIPQIGARIMSLQNPEAKMSKSDPDPNSAIYLTDTDDQIRKKIKRAVTDTGTEVTYEAQKPGVCNLIDIQAAISGKSRNAIVENYVGKQYGHLKMETAEIVVEAVRPIRDQTQQLMENKSYLDALLSKGASKASEKAAQTLARVYDKLGFIHGRYSSEDISIQEMGIH
jgi:tryptophanyl-tRNA synthetase